MHKAKTERIGKSTILVDLKLFSKLLKKQAISEDRKDLDGGVSDVT